jgi:hypothetical protein
MKHARGLAAAAAFVLAAVAGCGLGEGEAGQGEAELRVTRDYGTEVMVDATVTGPTESDTVMRVLDDEADVETRYGGAFVQAIDGVAGGTEGGRRVDWFFYVNGVESPAGATDVPVEPGDRIWWDHHDWTDVMRVPAVVGSFPQPLVDEEVRLECADAEQACADAGKRLADAGVDFTNEEFRPAGGSEATRVLVGEWERIREDGTAALLERGPRESGVFASPEPVGGGWALATMDGSLTVDDQVGPAGLVAALRPGEGPPTWVVTGTDAEGLDSAVAALDEQSLSGHFALALVGAEAIPLPDEDAGGG